MKLLIFICAVVLSNLLTSCEFPMNKRDIVGDYYYDCIFEDSRCDIYHIAHGITRHKIIAYSHNGIYILAKGIVGAYDKELEKHNIRAFFDSAAVYFLINHQTNEIRGPLDKDSLVQILIEENQTDLVSKPYEYINPAYLKNRF